MSMTSPEQTKPNPNVKGREKTIYDELSEIAEQKKLEAELAQLNQDEIPEEAVADVEPVADQLAEEDPLSAEANAEQLDENEKYLADLMHHMKSQQPEIYKDALAQIASERSTDSDTTVTPEDLDTELEEKIAKQGSIPNDLLAEMTEEMRSEEMRSDSTVWKEINANGMVGDIARRWRDMYRRAMNEILR